ncbi:MAG: hypothetical protein OHK0022_34140 [Roseiflexaceae bacterium]
MLKYPLLAKHLEQGANKVNFHLTQLSSDCGFIGRGQTESLMCAIFEVSGFLYLFQGWLDQLSNCYSEDIGNVDDEI